MIINLTIIRPKLCKNKQTISTPKGLQLVAASGYLKYARLDAKETSETIGYFFTSRIC